MKRWLRACAPLAIGGLLLSLASCKGDEGPPGPSGTADCMKCHTDDFGTDAPGTEYYLRPIQTQFALSRHNLSDTYVRRGTDASPTCSRCHTTEGFQVFIETGAEAPLEGSSHIHCFACHAPHENFDFSQRKQSPTDFIYGESFDHGPANTCAVCHQARYVNPEIAQDVPIPSSNQRWGPHYGPQANVLEGEGAWSFTGEPFQSDAAHNTANAKGCVTCHMAELPANTIAGGHSFAINYESRGKPVVNSKGCTCHQFANDDIATDYTRDFQVGEDTLSGFRAELEELGDMLVARGWLQTNHEYATFNPGPPAGNPRGAVWNFLLLEHDKSLGVHNKVFGEDVIAKTKAWLEANP